MAEPIAVSYEVYPARNPESIGELENSILELAKTDPNFISVTFGAGGSSTKNSLEVLGFIKNNTSTTPLAHITCVGNTFSEARELVASFLDEGITNFLALRGDLPQDPVAVAKGELKTAAELVQLIQSVNHARPEPAKNLRISVAAFPGGHPESDSIEQDVQALLAKQLAGASFAITQVLFEADDYFRFVDRARAAGVEIPILPGIMPVTSLRRLNRVIELTGQADSPALRELLSVEDSSVARERGIDWVAALAEQLVAGGVPGVHLYAFNQHESVVRVLRQSGIR